MHEKEDKQPLTSNQSLEELASRILVYSPHTALQRLAEDYMRQWLCWQPGVLFRYGYLDLRACDREIYLGGLTANQTLFILVPLSLYEQHRRAVLLQIARERLQTQDPSLLRTYCALVEAEKESMEHCHQTDHPAWDAEARARQVSYWARLLARRREAQTPDWRW
jgi:hypothetical protein